MRPDDVRYHHIRDWPWPQKWCKRHGQVPTFHECGIKAVFFAEPDIVSDAIPPKEQPQ